MDGDSYPTASKRPSASSDVRVTDIVRDTTATVSTSETTTTISTDNILGTSTTIAATGGSFPTDGIVTANTVSVNKQRTALLMYGITKDETSTSTPNIFNVRGTTDTSASVETSSSTDNTNIFDAKTVSSLSMPVTNTIPSTYFIRNSVAITTPKESLDSTTMVDTGSAVYITFKSDVRSTVGFEKFPDLTDTALPKADTAPPRSLILGTGDTAPTPLGTTAACVTTFTSSATAASSSDSTDTAISGTYATNVIISTTRMNGGTETTKGASTTAAIPEFIQRSDDPPCNLAVDCPFTARNERTFPPDILKKTLPPDLSVMPEPVSVFIPDVPLEIPYPSISLPDIPCCDVPLRVPRLNLPPTEEGQPNVALTDVPLFNETLPNKTFPNEPPPDSPLITLSSTQSPLYIIRKNVPLPEKPLPAVPPKELRFDDPSTDVSLVEVLTPDIPSPAVPRPDLPLFDIPQEVPRLDEIPPDTLPTYLSPLDVLTQDVSPTKVPLLDMVPGTILSAVSAEDSMVSLLSSLEQGGSNAVQDKTIDQPDSGNDLATVKFNSPFMEDSKSVNGVLDFVPVLIDDPQNFSDDSSAPSNPLEFGQNSILEQPNTNNKVNEETGSTGLIFSILKNASKNYKPDLTQPVESLVVQAEGQSSTIVPIQESDQNKGPEDKNIEDQKQEKGTKCSSNWQGYTLIR